MTPGAASPLGGETLDVVVAVPEKPKAASGGLDFAKYLKLPGDGPAEDKMLAARDRFEESLVQSGNPPDYARQVADRTAGLHGRKYSR